MIKKIVFTVGLVILFNACSIIKSTPAKVEEENISKQIEDNQTIVSSSPTIVKEKQVVFLESVFSNDSDSAMVLIEGLDAYDWEKKVLKKAYSSYNEIWSPSQKDEFRKILDEDRYLSLCADKHYVDSLEVEEGTRQDILYSLLLLKYVNNLKYGCLEWVRSDGAEAEKLSIENIQANHLLSMLPNGVLINKLLLTYLPKDEGFLAAIERYKSLKMGSSSHEVLKKERLNVEYYKQFEEEPNYNE